MLQKVSVWVLAVSVVMLSLLMFEDDVRASVSKFFTEQSKQFFTVDFSSSKDSERNEKHDSGDFVIGYVPDSFKLSDEMKTVNHTVFVFENEEGRTLTVQIITSDGVHYIDNEDVLIENTQINGYEAIIIELLDVPTVGVVFGNENFEISIKGTLNREELIKIAKNITIPKNLCSK